MGENKTQDYTFNNEDIILASKKENIEMVRLLDTDVNTKDYYSNT